MHPDLSYMVIAEADEPDPNERGGDFPAPSKNKYFNFHNIAKLFIIFFALFCFFYFSFIASPSDFSPAGGFEIKKGMSVSEVGALLKEKNIIRSSSLFRFFVGIKRGNKGVVAGRYNFVTSANLFSVVKIVTDTGYGTKVVRVTIPEGLSNKEIAVILERELVNFDGEGFLKLAKDKEGYLFPDSYLLEPNTSPSRVIEMMSENFKNKLETIKEDLGRTRRSLKEIIVMASVLEEEARTAETRKMIAGILWKRFDDGYPLQVDASFAYILGKGSLEVTAEDMNVDSPYNTYKYAGLPPGPISNPGLEAIKDAIYPTLNKYWFYLSDRDGNMHYAVTFEEHKANKEKYLR